MRPKINKLLSASFLFLLSVSTFSQEKVVDLTKLQYAIYPEVNTEKPDLPSPFMDKNGNEYVIAVTKDEKYAIINVSLANEGRICEQILIKNDEFPELFNTGLHSEEHLNKLTSITGRKLEEITRLAKPGALSYDGFIADNETVISVIKGDNQLVKNLGFKHTQLAKPLFHVLNMMDADLDINRWNMAHHQWENIKAFSYNDCKVSVIAYDTKGGQKSIFNDGIEGAFHVKLWRNLTKDETDYLKKKYPDLSEKELEEMIKRLTFINIGEMQPQYILRYGFYEGHTGWRAEPLAIAFIFGLKTLKEIYKACNRKLYESLTRHYQALK